MPHVLFPALSRRSAISIADLPCYPAAARTKLRTKLTRAAARTRSAPHRDYTAAPYLRDECTVNSIDIDDPTLQQLRTTSVNLPRDSLLQLWIFSRASLLFCHELLSSCLNVSGPLLKSARSLSSAAPDHFCLICQETLFCSSGFSPVCHQLFSSCLNCLRASSLICQEPLFSSSGPLLFSLPRDSLLQL